MAHESIQKAVSAPLDATSTNVHLLRMDGWMVRV